MAAALTPPLLVAAGVLAVAGAFKLRNPAPALTAALSGAHGVGWVLQRPPGSGMLLALGTAGAVYAAVLAYTLLPQAWSAWSAEWR